MHCSKYNIWDKGLKVKWCLNQFNPPVGSLRDLDSQVYCSFSLKPGTVDHDQKISYSEQDWGTEGYYNIWKI